MVTNNYKIIEKNLLELQERIESACSRSIYNQESVELVISTKYVDADIIRILFELGVPCIGENQLQATERKTEGQLVIIIEQSKKVFFCRKRKNIH